MPGGVGFPRMLRSSQYQAELPRPVVGGNLVGAGIDDSGEGWAFAGHSSGSDQGVGTMNRLMTWFVGKVRVVHDLVDASSYAYM